MRALPFIAALLVCQPLLLAHAEEKPLSGEEIKQYLKGNVAVSREGESRPFRQTFAADGTTLYKAEGRPTEHGKWRVQGDQYCSQWGPGGWRCYHMTAEGDFVTWIGEGVTYPAKVIRKAK